MKTTIKISMQRAFTLIELLFVIAIIAVIASLGLSTVTQRAQEAKVEKAALQMQQLLQAGMTYYVDNGCWPGASECSPGVPNFANNYIPTGGNINPWGGMYAWGEVGGGITKMFEVDSPLSGSATTVVQRIAGMLPNGGVSSTAGACLLTAPPCTGSVCACTQATVPAQGGAATPVYTAWTADDLLTIPANSSYVDSQPIRKYSCATGYTTVVVPTVVGWNIRSAFSSYPDHRTSATIPLAASTFYVMHIPGGASPPYFTIRVTDIAVSCSAYPYAAWNPPEYILLYCGDDDYGPNQQSPVPRTYEVSYTAYCCKDAANCPKTKYAKIPVPSP